MRGSSHRRPRRPDQMAKISIYVPDELKARMDAAGDAINWSNVARPALQAALAAFEHKKGGNMEPAIERLKASKEYHLARTAMMGREDGRRWAANKATYPELRS